MKNYSTKWVLGHKITTYDTSGDYDLMMAETPAQAPGPPPHFHNNFKESFLIIASEMEFFINGEVKQVRAGEMVDIPPKTLHTFSNKGNSTCKWINIHSPKGFRVFLKLWEYPLKMKMPNKNPLTRKLFKK